jgi:hypothetical protein
MLIAAAGIAMLLYGAGVARPLWVDEEMIALNVRDRTLQDVGTPLWLDQTAPLGWFAIERAAMSLLGTSERALRLPTVLFGAGTLIAALAIGRRWMTLPGAAILVALCATGEWLLFFTLELKHYSSDAFWALGLPALAAWALEADAPPQTRDRRTRLWWIAAAAGQWFANGALFVAPACGAVLTISLIRRVGLKRALRITAPGAAAWTVSFAVNFALTLKPALQNAYLHNYWAFAFPPVADGAAAVLRWMVSQFRPVAIKPGGSGLWFWFWIAWAAGIAAAAVRRNAAALLYALVPASALALAVLGFVPPFERLGIWFVPSLYAGIAFAADAGARLLQRNPRVLPPLALGTALLALSTAVTLDIVNRGLRAFSLRPRSNYELDDRSSVRFLLANHRAGTPILTTHYGVAAIWWYGRIPIRGDDRGGRLPDGSPLYEITHADKHACAIGQAALTQALQGHDRVELYLGFRLNVEPPDFDEQVMRALSRRGRMVGYREYAEKSRILAFDLTTPGTRDDGAAAPCLTVKPAGRW